MAKQPLYDRCPGNTETYGKSDGRYFLDMYWGREKKQSTVQFKLENGKLFSDRAVNENITDVYFRRWILTNPNLRTTR